MITVVTNDSALSQFEELLKGLSGEQARRVMADALNKSGSKTRTAVKRELSRETGIKYGDIDRGMRVLRATPARLDFIIEQSGQETNLNMFGARQTARGVSSAPWRRRMVFDSTFLIPRFGNKVFQRTGGNLTSQWGAPKKSWGGGQSGRFPISQLWGPNLAREIVKDKPAQAFEAGAEDLQRQVMSQLIRRAIHGFGF